MAAVVQQNDLVFEFASNVMEDEQQVSQEKKNGFSTFLRSFYWYQNIIYFDNSNTIKFFTEIKI